MTIRRNGNTPVVSAPSVDRVLASHGVGHEQKEPEGRSCLVRKFEIYKKINLCEICLDGNISKASDIWVSNVFSYPIY